ncbi:33 kDa chaperonin [Diplonema papillatum]|nr:33 kDa chaperonin [Diplonema papillatum]
MFFRTVVLRCSAAAGARVSPLAYTVDRDACYKVIGKGGWMRAVFIQSVRASREALSRHGMDNTSEQSVALCKVMMLTSMLASFQGGEERVKLDYETPDASYSAEASATGEIRGHVREGTKVTGIPRTLRVSRILYHKSQPIMSITPASSDGIVLDAKDHFVQSDGQHSALWMRVDLPNGVCTGALVQAIPEAARSQQKHLETFVDMEDRMERVAFREDLAQAGSVMRTVLKGDLEPAFKSLKIFHGKAWQGPAEVMQGIGEHELDPDSKVARIPVDFYCRCSLSGFIRGLSIMGTEQITSLQFSQPKCPLTCQYCGKVHHMTPTAWSEALALAEADAVSSG